MSMTRLTFLYPHWFRGATHLADSSSHLGRGCRKPIQALNVGAFTTGTAARKPGSFSNRAGKGVEPPSLISPRRAPLPTSSASITLPPLADENVKAELSSKERKAQKRLIAGDKSGNSSAYENREEIVKQATGKAAVTIESAALAAQPTSKNADTATEQQFSSSSSSILPPPGQKIKKPASDKKASSDGPMEAILHMDPPSDLPNKPPHLSPPPYIHHFDTYSLVKQLENGGHTNTQAVTAMKAVRGLLATNLDVAQAGLVSKSDVENETYLFRAACSELSAEVRKNRQLTNEGLRQQRTLLQHEVDISTQTLNQELLTLTDNVRGMFNDRKMAVREEQKAVDSSIQQINYKISVTLNSDARSEIEGLRWVLIRRSVLGITFMAVVMLGSLRYATYVNNKHQREAEHGKQERELQRSHDGRRDISAAPEAAEILAAN